MSARWVGLSEDGKQVILKNISEVAFPTPDYYNEEWARANQDSIKVAAFVDTETSGKNCESDEIIEIGIKLVEFNKLTGELLKIGESLNQKQEPTKPLSEEITIITGLTMEELSGHSIDWVAVDAILEKAQIVVAHNAKFDRGFIERKSKKSRFLIWACTYSYVNWLSKGYTSSKLELLNVWHGYFAGSHRALNDVDSLILLMTFSHEGRNYFSEVLENARSPQVRVIATGAHFDTKDLLKGRSYQWDNFNKVWSKVIKHSDISVENEWLCEAIYHGKSRATIVSIRPEDTFKE